MMFDFGTAKGLLRRRLCADRTVLDPVQEAGHQDGRSVGHENPRAGLAVPARIDPSDGRQPDRDDACRRAAGPAAGHHQRHADDHDHLHNDALLRCGQVRHQHTDQPYVNSIGVMSILILRVFFIDYIKRA